MLGLEVETELLERADLSPQLAGLPLIPLASLPKRFHLLHSLLQSLDLSSHLTRLLNSVFQLLRLVREVGKQLAILNALLVELEHSLLKPRSQAVLLREIAHILLFVSTREVEDELASLLELVFDH